MEERTDKEQPTMPVPVDLPTLIADLPTSSDPSQWTEAQKSALTVADSVYAGLCFRDYGTDEDWELLSPYFPGGRFSPK